MGSSLKQVSTQHHFVNYLESKSDGKKAVVVFMHNTARELYLNKQYISPWQIELYKHYDYTIISVVARKKAKNVLSKELNKLLQNILNATRIQSVVAVGNRSSCQIAIDFARIQSSDISLNLFSPSAEVLKENLPLSSATLYCDPLKYDSALRDKLELDFDCTGLGNQTYNFTQLAGGMGPIINNLADEVNALFDKKSESPIYQRNINTDIKRKTMANGSSTSIKTSTMSWRQEQLRKYTRDIDNYLIDRQEQKIFCIGFHKTGTTSMHRALNLLGYRVKSHYGQQNKRIGREWLYHAIPLLNGHDAFEDMPWPLNFKLWDELYPNAKFILTTRDPESWYRSVCKYFGEKPTETRKWIYGRRTSNPLKNKEHFIKTYNTHNQAVLNYFRERETKLLYFNMISGDGWDKLCDFLDKGVPSDNFPHSNKTK